LKPLEIYPFIGRAANAALAWCFYLQNFFWPANLAVFYPYRRDIPPVEALLALALLATVTAIALRAWRRFPALGVGWFWYLGTLVPVIGIVQVGAQAMADRYAYLPTIGLSVGLAWSSSRLIGTRPHVVRLVALAAGVVACMFFGLTWKQLEYWRNDVTLFRHAATVTRDNALAHGNLGAALLEGGAVQEAKRELLEAIRLGPGFARPRAVLGDLLIREGDLANGIAYCEEALRLAPDYFEVRLILGTALSDLGRLAEAEKQLRHAVHLRPDLPVARMNLANTLSQLTRYPEAEIQYLEALRLAPNDPQVHFNRAVSLAAQGRIAEAESAYRTTLRLAPGHEEARRNLASLRDPTR
jgi:Flp pilus assembly protein TadD